LRVLKSILSLFPAVLLLVMAHGTSAQDPSYEWYKEIATGGDEFITAVAVDPADNSVYAVGYWSDDLSATWPDGTFAHSSFSSTFGSNDGFVVKYDSDGNYQWGFRLGSVNRDGVNSVTVDSEGSVYITGFFGEGTGYFYGTSAPAVAAELTNSSNEDFFLAKYDAAGAFQWVRRSESNGGNVEGLDVCTNSTSVFAVGSFIRSADFGPLITGSNPLNENIFMICYDKAGNEQWITTAGSGDPDIGRSVVADDNAVYITGSFAGANLDIMERGDQFGGLLINGNSGTPVIPIISYDLSGYFRWATMIESGGGDIGRGLCLDSDSLYLTGAISNNADFPSYSGNPVSTSSGQDIFLSSHAKTDGSSGWVQVFPTSGSGNEKGRNLVITPENHLILIGEFQDDLTFPGGTSVTSLGSDDVFLAAYTTVGGFVWGGRAGSSGDEDGNAIAVGSNGTLYAAGLYDNDFDAGPFLLGNDAGDNGFLLKLRGSTAPPLNDLPCGALLLNVGDTCASEVHDNLEATDSGIPDPGCGSYAGADVWFKAVVPPSGNLHVGTNTTNDDIYPPVDAYLWNVNLAVYRGDCNSLIELGCFAGNSAYNSRASSAYLFDQVPGDTLWIRVWEASAAFNGNFSICAYDPGHFPGWYLAGQICEDNGPIDLDTTLTNLTIGHADVVINSVGIPSPDFALGTSDGSSAVLEDNGDLIVLDLSDTIPAGETFKINMRSNPVLAGETRLVLRTSVDNISYVDHSFRPETSSDTYLSHIVIAEEATRYVWIENNNAGGGGFQVDGIEYFFRASRGGSWSGPGVTGTLFDPSGLLGPVSITYSAGGSNTRTDSIRSVEVLSSLAGTLGNDTTVCSGDPGLQLNLQGHRGVVIGWESSTDLFLSITPIPVFDAFLDVSGLTVTTSYRAIVQEGACEPDTTDILTVTILEIPSADPGAYSDVCGINLGLQALPSVGTGSWTASGPGTATFTPSENDPIVSVDVDQYGTYTFTWTELNGNCSDDSTFTVEFFEPPVVDPGAYGDVCGSNLGLQALPSVGSGTWTASGPGTATFTPSATDPVVSVDVDQYGTYTFTWTEVNGSCSDDSTFTVEFFEPPVVDPGPYGDVCGSNLGLQAIPSLGMGSWMASGPGTATFTPSAADPVVSVDVDQYGTYTFTWTEVNGSCSEDSTFTVEFFEPPVAVAGVGGDACGLSYTLNAVPSVGTGNWTLETGPGTALFSPVSSVANTNVTVSQTGIYDFTWTETNGVCSESSVVSVNFIESPVAVAGTGGNWCGPDFQLSAIPSIGMGLWTQTGGPGTAIFNPSADVSDARVTVDINGIYEFTWTENNALCVDQDSVEVTFLDNLLVDAGTDADVCGSVYDLSALPQDVPGIWSTSYGPGMASFAPSEAASDSRVTVDVSGEYMFRWEAALGICTGADSLIINFHTPPVANAGPDQVLEFEFSTYLEASLLSADVAAVNAAGRWNLLSGSGQIENPGDPLSLVSGLQLGENVFQWTLSSNYCPDVSDQVSITVNDVQTYTVITPNNDGLNDYLVFPGVENLLGCEIVIFNRWGVEVYRNEDYQNNWDGRDHRDRDLIADTYYYILRIPPDRVIKNFVEIRRSP